MSAAVARLVGRRWVVKQAGRGVLGFAVLGVAACSDGGPSGSAARAPRATSSTAPSSAKESSSLAWSRVDLGFVAAYVLVRGREVAVVDTGVGGSAGAIEAVLDDVGSGWAGVRHVILTHKHPDHAGSIGDVLTAAETATGYIGAEDLSEVDAPRPLRAIRDGDDVFGLQVVGTPGHTAGHVAVFDPAVRLLVAGDALTNEGELAGSNPQFTEDTAAAANSVGKLAELAPRTILVGHGPPVVEDAAAMLRRLAASVT
jgi:glyoxylase-like metal-dependent hydrolase (beta-lactamase superfamily II)